MAKRTFGTETRKAAIAATASSLIRTYRAEPSKWERTNVLKRLASMIVELRGQFTLADGRPDWSGRSSEYRETIGEIYRAGGIPEDELDTFQAALRYHVGNRLREVAPAEELKDAGLGQAGPRERLHNARNVVAAVNTLGISGGGLIKFEGQDRVSFLDSLLICDRILREVTLDGMSAAEEDQAREALVRIAKRCIDLI